LRATRACVRAGPGSRRLPCLTGCCVCRTLTRALRCACSLLESLRCITGLLAHLSRSLANALPYLPDRPANTLLESAKRLPGCLAEPAERLARLAGELTDRAAGAECLSCRIRQPANCLACRSAGSHSLLADLADVADRVVERLNEPLENLWVPIQGCKRAIENVVEILQPYLQSRLGLDALYVHLDLAQADVDSCDHLKKVGEFRPEREMRLEVLDVNVDLLDLQFADVHEDIRVVTRIATLEMFTVQPARAARPRTGLLTPASVPATGLRGTPTRRRILSWHNRSYR
jgi:hypothetical protein